MIDLDTRVGFVAAVLLAVVIGLTIYSIVDHLIHKD